MLAAVPVVFRVSDAVQTIRDSFLKLNFENVILPIIMFSLVFACFFFLYILVEFHGTAIMVIFTHFIESQQKESSL